MAKCVSCNSRKGKRNCPGTGGVICTQCCGSKRGKEIDCPQDCFYLDKSKEYFTDKQTARKISDFEREMKNIIGNEGPYEDVLQNIEFIIHKISTEYGDINDRDVESALDYIMEMGKAEMGLPSKFLTKLPLNIQRIVDAMDDVLELRESIAKQKEPMMDKLKCIYRVLDSVRTHYNPQNDCSYLLFVGQFLT